MKFLRLWMFAAILLLCGTNKVWTQSAINDIPAKVDAADATITKMGHATVTMKREIVTDPLTLKTDTLMRMVNVEWNTEKGTARRRMAQRRAATDVVGSDFKDKDSSWYLDMWWFNYNYPSINAEGEPVLLSANAAMPDEDCSAVNNVIIGCHITITSNKECPSHYSDEGSILSDVNFLQNFASSGLGLDASQDDMSCYNLVILPDYEGYGITAGNAHPYLYQELTARQVVDAARYGIQLYKTSSQVDEIRHPFRNGWRTITMGYSQGGSVALATQRFIEQNGLTDELQLAGSVCGDGPYDLMSTLLYYVDNDIQGKVMTMPVVLPLILKGMCDSNPYMKNHQVSDYLSEQFLATGIIDWITAKDKSTDDITDAWKKLYKNGQFTDILTKDGTAKLSNILKPEGFNYFTQLYQDNKDTYTSAAGIPLPAHRGLMEDLHFALESNNMIMGWQPQHAIFLYHSFEDTVVPEKNRERAANTMPDWVIRIKASGKDHVDEGNNFFFFQKAKVASCISLLAAAPVHQTVGDVNTLRNSSSDKE